MNAKARTTPKDGVLLMLAMLREAVAASGLEAGEAIAIIPAPGALRDVPGQRGRIADLWCPHTGSGFAQHGPWTRQGRMLGQLAQGDQAADPGFRGRRHERTGLAYRTQIDHHVGLVGAVFDLL